jgi:beta-lactam-binding protein with PASTA domain
MLKGIFEFIKSKTFFKNLAIYIVAFLLLCWFVVAWLGSYTSHGETVVVPDFSGVKLADLDKFVSDKKLRYMVIDSLYDTKSPSGVVIKQEPEANEKVKDNRTVYLYVTSLLPPSIQMPKLVDRSLRQAASMITTYGLKLGYTKFVSDQCANCVLEQYVKGKKIEPGATIPKGTVIDLIVGKGLGDEETGVPCLYGLTRREALKKLSESSLSAGAINFDVPKDSLSAKVYKQLPACGKETNIKIGGTVDLFFTADKSKIPSMPADTSSNKKDDENFDN